MLPHALDCFIVSNHYVRLISFFTGFSSFHLVPKQLSPGVSHAAKVVNRDVHGPGFQMRSPRAPHTEIYYRTTTALVQEVAPVRSHFAHVRDKGLPGLFEIPFLEIIDTTRMPERPAESKKAIVTDIEALIAGPAAKKMIAFCGG